MARGNKVKLRPKDISPQLPAKPDKTTTRRCPTYKRQFLTEHDAQRGITEAKLQRFLYNRQRRREIRAYKCDECAFWHITSHVQPPESLRK